MSADQARAALPSATWHEQRDKGPGAFALMTETVVAISGSNYYPLLEFEHDQLVAISFGRPSFSRDAAICAAEAVRAVVSLEGEGAFVGAATGTEGATTPMETRTAGGSIVRSYAIDENGAWMTYANRPGEPFAEVVGGFTMRPAAEGLPPTPECFVVLRYGDDPSPPALAPIDVPTETELSAATRITNVPYVERPRGSDFARWYPPEAMRTRVEGRVDLDCLVGAKGFLRCAIDREEPEGVGFGAAAQQIASLFRAQTELDGESTIGKRVRQSIVFRLGS